jgi:spore coat protein CotH
MTNPKVDITQLRRMLKAGKTVKECAKHFSVTPGAISQHKKSFGVLIVKDLHSESAHRVVGQHLDTVDQLKRINTRANEILDKAGQEPALALKAMNERRGQLKLQNETLAMLAEMSAVMEFQQELIQLLKEVDENVKNEFLRRLSERRALRGAVRLT